jgi:ribokinase
MDRPNLVVIGSSNTDLVVQATRIPAPGETVLGSSYKMVGGGKGANQAVAAARLGANVTFVARVGSDAFGEAALEGLLREGVATDFVFRDEQAHSGVALIVVDEQGENAIAVAPGANNQLCVADVDRAKHHITKADAVLLQLEIPLEVVLYSATLATEAGVPVILNPAPARPLTPELLHAVTVLTPNQHEAALLSGVTVTGSESAREAGHALRRLGVPTVVITLGAAGALLVSENIVEHVPGSRVVAVDTTAAGDSFSSALAVALAAGMTLTPAAHFAAAAGALAVTRVGAQPSLPTRSEVEDFLRS